MLKTKPRKSQENPGEKVAEDHAIKFMGPVFLPAASPKWSLRKAPVDLVMELASTQLRCTEASAQKKAMSKPGTKESYGQAMIKLLESKGCAKMAE